MRLQRAMRASMSAYGAPLFMKRYPLGVDLALCAARPSLAGVGLLRQHCELRDTDPVRHCRFQSGAFEPGPF